MGQGVKNAASKWSVHLHRYRTDDFFSPTIYLFDLGITPSGDETLPKDFQEKI